jgi:arylsulfatase A-like enzyme
MILNRERVMKPRLRYLPLVVFASACAADQEPAATRLVDLFEPSVVSGSPPAVDAPPRTEWRFDGTAGEGDHAETGGVESGPGVTDLVIRDGYLTGRTTTDVPVLRVERTEGLDDQDELHAVEVRLRVSAGSTLQVTPRGDEEVDLDELPTQLSTTPFRIESPIVPGDELQTYTLTSPTPVAASSVRHLIVVPTNEAGADFEIESIRVIFREEHLGSIPSGIGWHGVGEVYQETLVARSPETLSFRTTLGTNPWLDLSLGMVQDGALTFRVGIDRAGDVDDHVLEHTLTTPNRWERRRVDLVAFAGETVGLTLSLDAETDGAIGLWGSPVVRAADVALPETAPDLRPPSSAGSPPVRPRGVILIQADTRRRDHLGVFGYERETAPVLRQIAEDGALFRRSTAQATWTKVSTPSIMTSLYPLSHGVRDFADRLPAVAETLAEQYRAAGYATVAYSSVLFTGKFTNLHQGFEELHESGSVDDGPSSKTAREYVSRLNEWLGRHRDVPFFVFLHVFDPHDPFEPRQPFATRWADPERREDHLREVEEVQEHIDDPLLRLFRLPDRGALERAGLDAEAFFAYEQDWYDGSIRGMDAELGRLEERLRELDLVDDTLIVFTSDHGEEFLEHGRPFHGQSVYAELTEVPLVLRWPARIAAGVEVEERVQSIDIMPTLLDASGLPHPDGLQGRSLLPLLQAAGDPEATWVVRPAFSEKAITTGAAAPPPQDTESYSVIDGDWLLIHNTVRPDEAPEFELYDMADDPLNTTNVAGRHEDVVDRLSREIERWRRVTETARLPEDAEAAEGLSPAELERLRSLGYVR